MNKANAKYIKDQENTPTLRGDRPLGKFHYYLEVMRNERSLPLSGQEGLQE